MPGVALVRLRCTNSPNWLLQETKRGPDGLRGAMTMCDECAETFIRKGTLPPANYSLEWLP